MAYFTKAERARLIDAVLNAMLDAGVLTETQLPDEQGELVGLTNDQLWSEWERWCGG
jgi:hypothetical protein